MIAVKAININKNKTTEKELIFNIAFKGERLKSTNAVEIWAKYLVKEGKWIMNETTLHFIDGNGNKMFHLQMKGSGGLSQKNSMQFHIYKVC